MAGNDQLLLNFFSEFVFNFLFITTSGGANYNSLDLGRQFDESGTCFLFMKCVFGLGKLLARRPAESAGWIGEVDGSRAATLTCLREYWLYSSGMTAVLDTIMTIIYL